MSIHHVRRARSSTVRRTGCRRPTRRRDWANLLVDATPGLPSIACIASLATLGMFVTRLPQFGILNWVFPIWSRWREQENSMKASQFAAGQIDFLLRHVIRAESVNAAAIWIG